MEEEINLETRKTLMLNMLDVLLEYCKKHNLKVYLAAGTLLGAVRHHGYIPWDDDVDVMMPISDWNKLIECVENNPLPEPFFCSTPKNNSDHMWPFLKFIDSRTVLVEPVVSKRLQKKQEKYYGIYIDIFPMYGLPNEEKEKKQFQYEMDALYDSFKKATRVMNRRPIDSYILYRIRCLLYFVYCLPYKIHGGNYYLEKMNKLIRKYPLEQAEEFGTFVGIYTSGKDHVKTQYLKQETVVDFETLKCPSLANYHEILEKLYGNYMEIPPENQRHIHPSYVAWKNKCEGR